MPQTFAFRLRFRRLSARLRWCHLWQVASPGAVLLMYNGEGEIAAYLYDEAEEDY
ncbi:hypothetical protein [Luteolibacter marinus]|uniref:hypothetical protein n=1 Tax=Luteolibacter marinus TaxID=2776705 RepID=UPI001D019A7A|nr:hypothetical protein [Luteolibacter marinus]